ncbi:type VII secretion protein EccB [Streptomyces atratus]|uniref:type VII secretion protein EccB n=1 Tax=Streptomyces atratus TaxID=1893 RepID=UPI00166FE81A|nr:type VII secretion protein EccB [Streptomyces atratus]GGT64299.1 type VII secretion protein EccB [Streptomyces atratus]
MQSKRDQVQAHGFIMSRLTAGMLLAEPDAPDTPLGRTTRGVFIGVLIAVLLAAGAVVYGLISPGGNTSWKTPGTLVVNKETGARYLYVDGRLRPVRNYASARLIAGSDLATSTVATASLKGTPVGQPIGIPGAPESVPSADNLDRDTWLVCSTTGARASDGRTTLVAGSPVEGTGVGAGQGFVAQGPDHTAYLVWQGSRLRLDKDSGAAVSLGYGSVTPRPVSAAFLNALVAGPDLLAPEVPDRGDAGPSLDGKASATGQVFQAEVPGSDEHPYYLLRKEGLVPVTATQAALVLGDPHTRDKAYAGQTPRTVTLSADALKQHLAPGAEGRSPATEGLPAEPPKPAAIAADESACAGVEPGDDGTKVTTLLVATDALTPVAQPSADVARACLRVDAVVVRPGRAALVRALGAGGTTLGTTTYLVDDTGTKFRVPAAKALGALGYSEGQVTALPSPLLSMLPTGPALDPDAATGATRPTVQTQCPSPGR